IHCLPLDPRRARLRSLKGLLRGQALSLPYYHEPAMAAWVKALLARRPIERVLIYSSAMAQYVRAEQHRPLHRVIDFVDVDSDKWRQYARSRPWPLNWVYRREADTLLEFDRQLAGECAAAVFVSPREVELFARLAPEVAHRAVAVPNGVDTDYFSPPTASDNPYGAHERVLVFTGAMDYWANVDAVNWFARELFPAIHRRVAGARFYIVGSRPSPVVQGLEQLPGVRVTGAVADIRPYLAHAAAAVAPLRIARGVQNKVLEALAMARPVLATRAAMDGILPCAALQPLVADEPPLLVERAVELLDGHWRALGPRGRAWVMDHYSWSENLTRFEQLLQTESLSQPLKEVRL
ncbi:MAG: TIGR03087 family PEP-CTERM/XrtA system glycosyltransferase, partial [Candidatus Competibacteraceae bacterium]|nr:TIGR03087 family PEP-CTERM/XrtA system glycosyltransferase [Candidatus Competibacteraceae bacterium]